MNERSKSTIQIKRKDDVVSEVLITPSSKYCCKLMGEHYITLSFVLLEPVLFFIGDYIDDEIFGRFVITEEVMPSDDNATGGYKYEIRFDVWYKVWNNKNLMLVTTLLNGTTVRKETSWYLTADLATQLEQVGKNLKIIGYPNFDIDIQDTLKTKYESHTMSYNGTKIVNALNTLANTWDCEYWITGSEDDFVIHFGKCEHNDYEEEEGLVFQRYKNVEKMTPQRNTDTYANKFYVFGSVDNVPLTYRKVCRFTPRYDAQRKLYVDGSTDGIKRTLRTRMFDIDVPQINGTIATKETTFPFGWQSSVKETNPSLFLDFEWHRTYNILDKKDKGESVVSLEIPSITIKPHTIGYYVRYSADTQQEGEITYNYYSCNLTFKEELRVRFVIKDQNGNIVSQKESYKMQRRYFGDRKNNVETSLVNISYGGLKSEAFAHTDPSANNYTYLLEVEYSIQHYDASAGTILSMKCEDNVAYSKEDIQDEWWVEDYMYIVPRFEEEYNATAKFTTDNNKSKPVKVYLLNADDTKTESYICINPFAQSSPNNDGYLFVDKNNKVVSVNARMFEIAEEDILKIPTAYFVSEYDNESSLMQIGEHRLMLPVVKTNTVYGNWVLTPQGYIIHKDLVDNPNAPNVVEMAIAFNNIYPDGKMIVSKVRREERNSITSYDDGSKTAWKWYQYHMQLTLSNGSSFNFSKEDILQGQQLRVRFLVPSDITDHKVVSPCKLAGMQFQCGFNPSATINDIEEGRVVQEQDFAIVRNDDFGAKLPNETLRPNVGDPVCLVGWDVRRMDSLGLVRNAEDKLLVKSIEYADAVEESQFVINCEMMSEYITSLGDDDNLYNLPDIGQKVKVVHSALKGGVKLSRIIGMECKLDKPYDTPKFIIGETDASSRLKKLEKEITKIIS